MHSPPALILFIILVAMSQVGCSEAIPRQDSETSPNVRKGVSVDEAILGLGSYRQMTEEAVLVNPELAALCSGASESIVEKLRESKGPHAHSAILVLMNALAAEAFQSEASRFPEGSVVVKKKELQGYYAEDSGKWLPPMENGMGGMIKRAAGYDPENHDWEYFHADNAGKIESGKMTSCIDCHRKAEANDFVFGSWDREPEENWITPVY